MDGLSTYGQASHADIRGGSLESCTTWAVGCSVEASISRGSLGSGNYRARWHGHAYPRRSHRCHSLPTTLTTQEGEASAPNRTADDLLHSYSTIYIKEFLYSTDRPDLEGGP